MTRCTVRGVQGLPLRCDSCGYEFEDRHGIHLGPNSGDITITGFSTDCARSGCSGTARQIVEGTFSTDESARWSLVKLFKPSGITLGDYESAIEAIRFGQERNSTPEQIAEDVSTASPKLAEAVRWAKSPAGIATILTILIGIAALARDFTNYTLSDEQAPAPAVTVNIRVTPAPPDDQIRRLIEEHLQEFDSECSPPGTREGGASIEQGRNVRCHCGSGHKYKHCCGTPNGVEPRSRPGDC